MTLSDALRVGVLGGTFDPIHYGHLVAAQEVLHVLKLDRVLFVPAGQPPHKTKHAISSVEHRLAMVDMAIADNPGFRLSRLDVDRPGPSFTVDTIEILQEQLGPKGEIFFIIGLDWLADLLSWHNPARLVTLCRIVAVTRPGYQSYDLKSLDARIPCASERISVVNIPRLDIAASDLRRRVGQGRPISYQLPPSVERYIWEQKLYTAPLKTARGGGA